MWRWSIVVGVALLAGAAAASASEPEVRVLYDRSRAPERCTAARIADRLSSLGRVDERTKAATIRRLLAPEPHFQWYSMTLGEGLTRTRHEVVKTPRAAVRLLRARAAVHEARRIVAVAMAYDARRNRADVSVAFTYRADDVPGGEFASGVAKATFMCKTGRLMVFSGGVDLAVREPRHALCGLDQDQLARRVAAGEPPIACGRRYAA